MTPEEKRKYSREYRREGFGAVVDKRYRLKWIEKIRLKDRERKRKTSRRDGG